MAQKFLKQVNGELVEELLATIDESAGSADAGKVPALGADGRFDQSMMPVGTAGDVTQLLPAFETLAAGDFVNVFSDSGTTKMRKSDATTAGKEADGFVLAAVTAGDNGTMHTEGNDTQCTGLTPGVMHFLSTTPGLAAAAAPSASGNVVQKLGKARSATELMFVPGRPITLA